MGRAHLMIWSGGLAAAFAALALWAFYGPLVFFAALNAVWTCF